jgi:Na+/melibiose symporter-like transporter
LGDIPCRLKSQVVSVSLVLTFAVEGIGRKKCLIMGGLGQGAMMLWIGGYSALHPATAPVTASPWSYISIVAVYLYAAFYSAGWGPIPWIVAAEVAPNHLRTAVISIATGVNWYACSRPLCNTFSHRSNA